MQPSALLAGTGRAAAGEIGHSPSKRESLPPASPRFVIRAGSWSDSLIGKDAPRRASLSHGEPCAHGDARDHALRLSDIRDEDRCGTRSRRRGFAF
jgi:hypothetical protein